MQHISRSGKIAQSGLSNQIGFGPDLRPWSSVNYDSDFCALMKLSCNTLGLLHQETNHSKLKLAIDRVTNYQYRVVQVVLTSQNPMTKKPIELGLEKIRKIDVKD